MAESMLLQRTPLHRQHVDRGAKMVEFGGWDMPLQFTKVLEEHHAVRKACGLFDISHMGILSATSGDVLITLKALDSLVPQDLTKTYPGKAVYTQLLNEAGGVIDDIIVYRMPETQYFSAFPEFMIICNAANTNRVLEWLKVHLAASIKIEWRNEQYSLMALQGPAFRQVLEDYNLQPRELPKRFHIGEYQLDTCPVLLSRTGYTGEDGVEILVRRDEAVDVWEILLSKGEVHGLKPIGLAARDTLRLEAVYPLHGPEITEEITPLEAGLGWSVKLDKVGDFIGKSALMAQESRGLTRHFVCFEVLKKSIPRHNDLLYDEHGKNIGIVTSGSISPTLDKPIGVGYISAPEPPKPGTAIQVDIRGARLEAKVVERPFYRT